MKSSVTKPAAAVEQCQVKSRKEFNLLDRTANEREIKRKKVTDQTPH